MMMMEGETSPSVATTAPGTPAVVKPTYVAVLMPKGPGVDSDTAIMSASWAVVNQPVETAMF